MNIINPSSETVSDEWTSDRKEKEIKVNVINRKWKSIISWMNTIYSVVTIIYIKHIYVCYDWSRLFKSICLLWYTSIDYSYYES